MWASFRKLWGRINFRSLYDPTYNRRKIDKAILWPILKLEASNQGKDIETARDAFLYHCGRDRAWRRLSVDEIMRQVKELK